MRGKERRGEQRRGEQSRAEQCRAVQGRGGLRRAEESAGEERGGEEPGLSGTQASRQLPWRLHETDHAEVSLRCLAAGLALRVCGVQSRRNYEKVRFSLVLSSIW